jgi:hypothetical protein
MCLWLARVEAQAASAMVVVVQVALVAPVVVVQVALVAPVVVVQVALVAPVEGRPSPRVARLSLSGGRAARTGGRPQPVARP